MMEGQRRLLEQYNTNKQPRVSHKNPAPEAPVKPLGPPIPNKLTKGGAEEKSIYEEHPVYENMSSNEDKSNYSDHGDQEVYGEVLFKGKPKELQEENNYETFGEIGNFCHMLAVLLLLFCLLCFKSVFLLGSVQSSILSLILHNYEAHFFIQNA